jgi:hypothetical protein
MPGGVLKKVLTRSALLNLSPADLPRQGPVLRAFDSTGIERNCCLERGKIRAEQCRAVVNRKFMLTVKPARSSVNQRQRRRAFRLLIVHHRRRTRSKEIPPRISSRGRLRAEGGGAPGGSAAGGRRGSAACFAREGRSRVRFPRQQPAAELRESRLAQGSCAVVGRRGFGAALALRVRNAGFPGGSLALLGHRRPFRGPLPSRPWHRSTLFGD